MVLQNVHKSDLPNTFQIKHILECKRCVETCPHGTLLQDYLRVTIGLTPYGLQVWCVRHQANVIHVDFRGQRIPVNASAARGIIWPDIA